MSSDLASPAAAFPPGLARQEFSIATQILESVLEFAQAHPRAQVLQVALEIGELAGLEPEPLRFCYDSIKEQTSLKESTLEISTTPARVQCQKCSYEGPPKYKDGAPKLSGIIPTLQCPTCGITAQAIQGHDCLIKTIKVDEVETEDALMPA